MTIGEFEEDELDPVGRQFEGVPFPDVVSEEDAVGKLVYGEVQDSDEVDGREVVGSITGGHLFLDGESGVEKSPFIEKILMSELHLDDEARAVGIGAFDIDADGFAVGEGIGVLLGCVFQVRDRPFGNEFLEEEFQEPLPSFRTEGSFEPVIE